MMGLQRTELLAIMRGSTVRGAGTAAERPRIPARESTAYGPQQNRNTPTSTSTCTQHRERWTLGHSMITNDPVLPDSPDRSDLAVGASGWGCIKCQ